MKRTPETVANMNAVADAIEEFPELYMQGQWGVVVDHHGNVLNDLETDRVQYLSPNVCKTAHCIAGWVCWIRQDELQWKTDNVLLKAIQGPHGGYGIKARQLLGLTDIEAQILFNAGWQPDENLSVPDALRKIAGGADVLDVSAQRIRVDDWEES